MNIMIDFLNSFKSLVKLEKIHTDNNVFKLHYKFTVIMLIIFSILLTSKQYFGDPIDCDVQEKKDVIDTYCWIYGTYIIRGTLTEQHLPGLGNPVEAVMTNKLNDNDHITSQKYYQWVCIVLSFQALLFYIPRYLWKTWEGGLLRALVKDLGGPIVTATWNKESKDRLINYFLCGDYSHKAYALRFAFCELLNFINVFCQIILLDWFLTGKFTGYGVAIATYNGINPMTAVFPKLTKCTYYKFGPSGSTESRDAMCILPLNIVNEKVFLILWIWFLFLSIITCLQLLYRVFFLCFPKLRYYLLLAYARYLLKKHAQLLVKKLTYGDCFLLFLLGKNLNPIIFKDLLTSIASQLKLNKTVDISTPYASAPNADDTVLV